MSYTANYDPSYESYEQPVFEDTAIERSKFLPVPFLLPIVICAVSYFSGGFPRMTDFGMLLLFVISGIYLLVEIMRFPKRYGLGGIVLFGGVLIWLGQDYFTNWFLYDFDGLIPTIPAVIVSKAAFWHCVFIMFMTVGLLIPWGGWIEKWSGMIPEPSSDRVYLYIIVAMSIFGFLPFVFFTNDPLPVALYKSMFSKWVGDVQWTAGRTGNVNYNWGAYLAQVQQVGQIGAILAVFYAILISRSTTEKILCWAVWTFWVFSVFQDGRRGPTLAIMAPPIGLLFIKYHSIVASFVRRHSVRAYVIGALGGFLILVAIQFQATFRTTGYGGADFSRLELTKNQGNTMFSEGLKGWAVIPDQVDFFYSNYIGEGVIRPIPEQVYRFVMGIIPRALWNDKPIDPVWAWYNALYTGKSDLNGTTISQGMVGNWYFRYGPPGVVEGAILMGWLLGVFERTLLRSSGKPMTLLFSLGCLVWMFRCFRDFSFINLYGQLLGTLAFALIVLTLRKFFSAGQSA